MKLVRKFQGALAFYLSLHILLLLIFSISYIIRFLTYGLIAWGKTYATTLKPVVVLQQKAVRIINEMLTLALCFHSLD